MESSFCRAEFFRRNGGGTALKNDSPHHAGDRAAAGRVQVAVFDFFPAEADGYATTVVSLSPPSDFV